MVFVKYLLSFFFAKELKNWKIFIAELIRNDKTFYFKFFKNLFKYHVSKYVQ